MELRASLLPSLKGRGFNSEQLPSLKEFRVGHAPGMT